MSRIPPASARRSRQVQRQLGQLAHGAGGQGGGHPLVQFTANPGLKFPPAPTPMRP
ncbi:hypothetical protein IM697_15915 [Streptomyces ferrugineus]|uniref:Uncharacterized protein n=1 Tax=Streptomyces ferrugineus TaxID=1413221 RepID=A0A7M2SU25_9ACTN|nr:hypothetical protein [Streptomyces ferrugineus]QOV39744.1 hypothetical protein IM697_15915 [Streptomyces ferrugineus]